MLIATLSMKSFVSPASWSWNVGEYWHKCTHPTSFGYHILLNFHGSLISQIFVNFQPFAKLFQRKFFYTYTSVFTCIGVDGQHAAESTRNTLRRDNLRSKHCIADSYKFKCGQRCVTVRIRTCLYASPILLTCVACTWFRQQIREIIISSKTTIRENLALYGIYHGVLLVMV